MNTVCIGKEEGVGGNAHHHPLLIMATIKLRYISFAAEAPVLVFLMFSNKAEMYHEHWAVKHTVMFCLIFDAFKLNWDVSWFMINGTSCSWEYWILQIKILKHMLNYLPFYLRIFITNFLFLSSSKPYFCQLFHRDKEHQINHS